MLFSHFFNQPAKSCGRYLNLAMSWEMGCETCDTNGMGISSGDIKYWLVVWNMFSIQLGMSSSQLTNSIIFQRGYQQPATINRWMIDPDSMNIWEIYRQETAAPIIPLSPLSNQKIHEKEVDWIWIYPDRLVVQLFDMFGYTVLRVIGSYWYINQQDLGFYQEESTEM